VKLAVFFKLHSEIDRRVTVVQCRQEKGGCFNIRHCAKRFIDIAFVKSRNLVVWSPVVHQLYTGRRLPLENDVGEVETLCFFIA